MNPTPRNVTPAKPTPAKPEEHVSLLRNPVLILTFGLPLVAVLASFVTLGIVLAHPDSELPEQYHWEGFQLDRDFSRGERATALGVRAVTHDLGKAGPCQLELKISGAAPEALGLTVAHATNPALDRHVAFHRVSVEDEGKGASALYAGQCKATPEGHWRLELTDAAQTWSVRSSTRGSLEQVVLDAATAEDD